MKVCIVCPYGISSPGGVWNHIVNLSNQLRSKRIDHIIVIPQSQSAYTNKNNVYQIGKPYSIKSGGSEANIVLSLLLGQEIDKFLKFHKPDVVHIHEPFAGTLPMLFIKHFKGKIISTFHSNQGTNLYKFGLSKMFKFLYKKIDTNIAVSKSAESYISKYFPNKYQIIPNGINIQYYKKTNRSLNTISNNLKLIFIGRNDKRKGLKYLINCLQEYTFDFPISLTIIGHDYTGIKPDNIEVNNPGIVNEKNKIKYLNESDILCAPSLGNESFGIILLEAMASETVIIASNIEGYNHLVTHEKNGLLIEPKSSKSIYKAINSVYHNKKMKLTMLKNGNNIIKNYGWDAISDKIIDIYRNK
ncbi:MAG: glycosyltransferase family 4 protein [Dehalococcoidia bacterium]